MSSVAIPETYAAPEAEIAFENEQEALKLFSIRGRMGVLKYATHSFLWSIVYILLASVVAGGAAAFNSSGGAGIAVISLLALISLPLLFIMFSMAIKRLHDINMSGWFLIVSIVPIVNIFFFLFMMLKPGKSEANKFGAQSVTKGWEKVVGGICITLFILSMVTTVIVSVIGGVPAITQ